MREVSAKRAHRPFKAPPPIQDEVAKAWLKAHSEDFPLAADDKAWDFPESLKLGLPKP